MFAGMLANDRGFAGLVEPADGYPLDALFRQRGSRDRRFNTLTDFPFDQFLLVRGIEKFSFGVDTRDGERTWRVSNIALTYLTEITIRIED